MTTSYDFVTQIEFEADAINLKVIRNNLKHIFSDFNVDKKISDDMVIAINEACMNIIQHAYSLADNTSGVSDRYKSQKILIIIEKNNQHWRFEIIDFAPAVDIKSIRSRDLKDLRPGGLGVSFIRQIMDSVKYENLNDNEADAQRKMGNRLVLIKNIKKEAI